MFLFLRQHHTESNTDCYKDSKSNERAVDLCRMSPGFLTHAMSTHDPLQPPLSRCWLHYSEGVRNGIGLEEGARTPYLHRDTTDKPGLDFGLAYGKIVKTQDALPSET